MGRKCNKKHYITTIKLQILGNGIFSLLPVYYTLCLRVPVLQVQE